jgi:hypothetical protein
MSVVAYLQNLLRAIQVRVVLKVLGAITSLIGAVTTLLFAFGKLPVAYDAACSALPCPEQYAWVDSQPMTHSEYTKGEPKVFELPVLDQSPRTPGGPSPGPQRYTGKVVGNCAGTKSEAYMLTDGTKILASDPLLTRGWISPSWVGQPEGPDWTRFDRMAVAKFGWTPGFASNSRCSAGSHCTIFPAEIKAHAKAIEIVDGSGCIHLTLGSDVNMSADSAKLSVSIKGKSDTEALFSVVANVQTYTRVDYWARR